MSTGKTISETDRPVAIVQARMGSSRLPGKVLADVAGRPLLGRVVDRVRRTPGLADVVVATTEHERDDVIRELCATEGIAVFSGSEHDVLDRFHRAATAHRADPVLRVTADCPLVDPDVLGRLLALYRSGDYDHVAVAAGAGAIYLEGPRFPTGIDGECFSFAALEQACREATSEPDREHVTPFIWRQPERFRLGKLRPDVDCSEPRLTVDHAADLELVRRLYDVLGSPTLPAVMAYLADHPELLELNRAFAGAEGYSDVWQRPDAAAVGRLDDR